MADAIIDASELTAFGRSIARAHAKASIAVARAVKKGAQNVKDLTQEDLRSSSNKGIRVVQIKYELGSTGTTIYADIGPADSGKNRKPGKRKKTKTPPTVASIAFFGTATGGGTHKPPDYYAEQELPTLAGYVADAAVDAIKEVTGL